MDRYQLDLESSPFSQYEGNILPIARKLEHSGSGGWAVLCLSTDLFKDMLLETANGQETVIVTAAGDRIASIEEPGGSTERKMTGLSAAFRNGKRTTGNEGSWERQSGNI